MCAPEYRKGQTAAVSLEHSTGGRRVDVYDVVVLSVGPSWITVQGEHGQKWRFDHEGEPDDYVGHCPELWPSRKAAEAAIYIDQRWDRLQELARQNEPPEHLNANQIDTIILTLEGKPHG